MRLVCFKGMANTSERGRYVMEFAVAEWGIHKTKLWNITELHQVQLTTYLL